MDQSLALKILDEEFIFDCRRAIYWPRKKVLITTDLHWGKTEFFQQHGIAIPDQVFEEDLIRLERVLQAYDVQTMLVLGDMIHHEDSLTDSVIERIAYFRENNPCELILLKGNHDRYAKFPESWAVLEEKFLEVEEFAFTHEFQSKQKKFQFSGHIHPSMTFRSGGDAVRVPIFLLAKRSCLVPAFSHLTSGQNMRLMKDQKAIAVIDDGLLLFEK